MKLLKSDNEKQILYVIRYAPSIFIIILSFFIMFFVYSEVLSSFEKEKLKIYNTFIKEEKNIIVNDVKLLNNIIKQSKLTANEKLKKILEDKTNEAYELTYALYNEYKHTKSKEEIIDIAKHIFKTYRYNDGRGYFFFDNELGDKIIYPIDDKIEGKNFLNYKDAKGYEFVKTIVDTVKNKTERFDEYYWYKPGKESKELYKKISFYKYFEPFDMIIGTGEYVDEFNKNLQNKINETVVSMNLETRDYFYIIDGNGNLINNPNKNLKNKNYKNNENLKNFIINNSKKEQFIEYSIIENNKEYKKIGYLIKDEEWDWYIGKSFYLNKLDEILKEKEIEVREKYNKYLFNIFVSSLILLSILLITSYFVSKFLENRFKKYKKSINKYIETNIEQEKRIMHQSKMAAMGEMIQNIAHQWRQPLSVISTASSGISLSIEMGMFDKEHLKDNMDGITRSANFLSKTIEDFMNYFKTEKEQESFLMREYIYSFRYLIKDILYVNNIQLIIELNNDNLSLFTFRNELTQALINIINNAKDAILLNTHKDEDKIILIRIKETDSSVNIFIKDNGKGIPLKIIDKIFDPYFTTKHQSQGTGLGLYMSKQLIENLGGIIYVNNKQFFINDQAYFGAEFMISLPKKHKIEELK